MTANIKYFEDMYNAALLRNNGTADKYKKQLDLLTVAVAIYNEARQGKNMSNKQTKSITIPLSRDRKIVLEFTKVDDKDMWDLSMSDEAFNDITDILAHE